MTSVLTDDDLLLQDTRGPINGLGLWLPMRGNALDASGNGLNGTVTGAVLAPDRWGRSNRAYSLDGVDDHIQVATGTELAFEGTAAFSLALWLYFDSSGAQAFPTIMQRIRTAPTNDGWSLGLRKTTPLLSFIRYVASDSTGRVDKAITADAWVHVAATYDGASMRVYLDGVQQGAAVASALSIPSFAANTEIGQTSALASPMKGSIADPRVFTRALSSAEVWQLYRARVP